MAMKFNKHDVAVTLGVARCGTMTYQNLKDLGYSDSRIKNRSCGDEKLLNYIGRDCKTGDRLYQLTEVGKEHAQRLGIDRADQYRCQGKDKTMNFEHDRKLSEVYCSLREEERGDTEIRAKSGSITFVIVALPKVQFQKVGFLKSIEIYVFYTSKLQQIRF